MWEQGKKFLQLIDRKKVFLVGVFSNLLLQLAITYWTMMNKDIKNSHFWWYIIIQFAIIFALTLRFVPPVVKFFLFSLFSFLWGLIFSVYRSNPLYGGLIKDGIIGTAGIFGAMFIIGILLILFGIQLGIGFFTVLFFSLILLIIMQLVGNTWVGGFSIILFSLYIIYDTNYILQRDYRGDVITASLDYYLDSINIFSALLNNQ